MSQGNVQAGVEAMDNGREIIFEVFQPMWSRYLNVTDGQTDGRTTYCGITVICVASRGKKIKHKHTWAKLLNRFRPCWERIHGSKSTCKLSTCPASLNERWRCS